MVIDVDKFVASLIKYYCEAHSIDRTIIRCWFDDVLEEQGLEYKDGEIVKTQRRVAAEAKEAIFDDEDEKIRKDIIRILKGEFGYTSKADSDKYVAWLEKQKVADEEIIFRPAVGTDIRIAAKQALEKIEIGKKVVLAFNGAYIPVNGKTVAEIDSEYDAWLEKQGQETSWKPSKEEMDVLYGLAYITNQYDEYKEEVITRLYQDLKREFFNGSSYENMFLNTEDEVRRRSTIQVLEYAKSLDAYNQYGKEDIDKNIAWLEKQVPIDMEKVLAGARKDVAMSIMNYLDDKSVGMRLSEMEREDIEDALINSKWNKLYNYMKKKLETQGEQQPADKVEPRFKVKYAGSEYNVLEIKDIAGVTFYGIEDEPNHIDYVQAANCERVNGYNIKENGSPFPIKPAKFSKEKPAWSEDDERMYKIALSYIETLEDISNGKNMHADVKAWLQSLKTKLGGK